MYHTIPRHISPNILYIFSSILLLNLKSQLNFHMAESTEFNVAYDKCDGTDNPEGCIETSYLSWKDAMLGIHLPDSIVPDGGINRPVGQFVTKNQAKNNRRKKKNKKKKTLVASMTSSSLQPARASRAVQHLLPPTTSAIGGSARIIATTKTIQRRCTGATVDGRNKT